MLSRKTKYGLKALSYLARENSEDPVQIVVISESENISQKFLESILLILKKAGILQSKKGKGGGYFLAKPAEEITIASVLRVALTFTKNVMTAQVKKLVVFTALW